MGRTVTLRCLCLAGHALAGGACGRSQDSWRAEVAGLNEQLQQRQWQIEADQRRINELMAEQQRLMELLKEKRQGEGIDLSKVVLTHHNLKDQGKRALPLGEGERPLTRIL